MKDSDLKDLIADVTKQLKEDPLSFLATYLATVTKDDLYPSKPSVPDVKDIIADVTKQLKADPLSFLATYLATVSKDLPGKNKDKKKKKKKEKKEKKKKLKKIKGVVTDGPQLSKDAAKQLSEQLSRYADYVRWIDEGITKGRAIAASKAVKPAPTEAPREAPAPPPAPAPAPPKQDDDDVDLFGSDEEDEEEKERMLKMKVEAAKIKAAAEGKKPKAPVIAKSSLLIDVKPWDDETDMKALEEGVRALEIEGLTWGASKLIPVAFGVKKLQIMATIVDDLVSTDDIEEKITAMEDYVQSMDIAAFNKI